jgi:hypothetical protein
VSYQATSLAFILYTERNHHAIDRHGNRAATQLHQRSHDARRPPLAGAIIWRKDDDEPIKVMARDGEIKNVLWARINGQRYAFSYNHSAGEIEMRRGSTQGPILQAFSNATPLAKLKRVFENL